MMFPPWYHPKRTYQLEIEERNIDNQETSPLGLVSTIIWEREQSDQESAADGKIALADAHK